MKKVEIDLESFIEDVFKEKDEPIVSLYQQIAKCYVEIHNLTDNEVLKEDCVNKIYEAGLDSEAYLMYLSNK